MLIPNEKNDALLLSQTAFSFPKKMNNHGVVLFRKVKCKHSFTDTEIFVVLQNGVLDFPPGVPDRFATRIQHTDLDFVKEVYSLPFDNMSTLNRDSLAVTGLWITEDDTVSRGQVSPRVFGIPLSDVVCKAWLLLPREVAKQGTWRIRVAYHGTDATRLPHIFDHGLLPSFGQLGTGVYVGTFWKACRFAVRDQDYKFRTNPVVVRVLWMCDETKQLVFPRESPCTCVALCAGKDKESARACAHELDWSTQKTWQSGFLPRTSLSTGTYVTRNEEWVFAQNAIDRLQQVVQIDVETVHGPHYDPEQRNIDIL